MKTAILVILAFVATANSQFVPGELVSAGRGGRAFYSYNPQQTCNTSPPGTSYCNQNSNCLKNGVRYTCTDNYQYVETTCSEPTPYCTGQAGTAVCTAFPEASCETGANYPCQGIGFYPDLNDCYTYYNCFYDVYSKKIVAQQYNCNDGYPFNPAGPGDAKCFGGGECVLPKCSGSAYDWQTLNYTNSLYYYSDNRMAVYCLNGRPRYAFECPSGMSVVSASSSVSPICSIRCTKDYQRAPDINNISKYYECRSGTAYYTSCLPGKMFDPYTLQCISAPPTPYPYETTTYQLGAPN